MTIKTLTTFDVYNYGASLQAYALMTFLRKLGHDVEIIDYQPEYLTRKYNYRWVNPESPLSKTNVTRALYRFMKFVQRQTTMKRKRAFDDFHNTYLTRTHQRYQTPEELQNYPPVADIYIVGSDQVWNVFYETGQDNTFFLDFVKNGKKISYAASFSYIDLNQIELKRIQYLLKSFSAIGVREYHGIELLNKINIKGNWTLDPVFLLTAEDWKSIAKCYEKKESYILVYDFENNKDLKHFVYDYSKKNNLKIYSINDTYPQRYADKNFNNAGPLDFISLIINCDAFVSNSFHGTAFSIIFNKPVFVFNRKRHKVNSRMESLLRLFDLSDNLFTTYSPDIINKIEKFDYNKINSIIENERLNSIEFLKSNL